jgi:hypothetical protein
VLTVPLIALLEKAGSPVMAGALICVAMVLMSFYTSVAGIIKAELFPTQVRALGVGFPMPWPMPFLAAARNMSPCGPNRPDMKARSIGMSAR